jgi:hypothetical protein
MTPTLTGRLQTRIFLTVTVGILWTVIITPFLPEPTGVTLGVSYAMAFGSLVLMAAAGLVWEFVYQGIQQWRWDKDWPSIFALLTVVNEALLVWLLDHLFPVMSGPMAGMGGTAAALSGTLGPSSPYLPGFVLHIGTTWLAIWLFSQGPMRVVFVRWRFEGGQIVHSQIPDPPLAGGTGQKPTPGANGIGRLAAFPAAGLVWPDQISVVASTEDVVEGATCAHGHFSHPGLRYCMTCGVSLVPLADRLGLGQRPPLGILILEDGTTHVLDHEIRLTVPEGSTNLVAVPVDEIPAVSALAEIHVTGWQPAVSSDASRIVLALPNGSQQLVTPGESAPLVPGVEFTIGRHQIRYESPYSADLHVPGLRIQIAAAPSHAG